MVKTEQSYWVDKALLADKRFAIPMPIGANFIKIEYIIIPTGIDLEKDMFRDNKTKTFGVVNFYENNKLVSYKPMDFRRLAKYSFIFTRKLYIGGSKTLPTTELRREFGKGFIDWD